MLTKNSLAFAMLAGSFAGKALAEITSDSFSHGRMKAVYDNIQEIKRPGKEHLYIHLLPHSHDDVGWLKTVDEYFTGTRQNIQWARVEAIIDTVIDELILDESKVFTLVEMKFFSMWWNQQTDEKKHQVRWLVQENRLEFVNAGWSMHDEACTHADDMMNNMMVGHEFLAEELDYKPRIGWMIDPFGHSNANARLYAEMGFDAWFFTRMDWQDLANRRANKEAQWIQRPMYDTLGEDVQIWTMCFRDGYTWVGPLGYDERFLGQPTVSDPTLETFDADDKAAWLYDYAQDMHAEYRGNHIAIPWGGDFAYGNAHMTFWSSDNLVEYFNEKYPDATVFYSTPYMYMDAMKSQDIRWPVRYEDLFPYADRPEDYWTGYFSSRANSKSQVRGAQANFHASNKLFSLKVLDQSTTTAQIEQILSVKMGMLDALGINQHHDAITGTAKQAVADDYLRRMAKAVNDNDVVYKDQMKKITKDYTGIDVDSFGVCTVRNGTYTDCPIGGQDYAETEFLVSVHNPSTVDQQYPHIKVPVDDYIVSAWDSAKSKFVEVEHDRICFDRKVLLHEDIVECDLYIDNIVPANHFSFFKVQKLNNDRANIFSDGVKVSLKDIVHTDELGAEIDVDVKDIGMQKLYLQMRWYNPATESSDNWNDNKIYDWSTDNAASGAYLFKPKQGEQASYPYSDWNKGRTIEGKFVTVTVMDWHDKDTTEGSVGGILRQYKGSDVLEYEANLLGIKDTDGLGKEVISVFSVKGLNNEEEFYTDSNAMQMQYRKLNYRESWSPVLSHQPVASNYYPINSAIAIRDKNTNLQMTVMNDRSQGGSVIENGRIELLQNRRLFYVDGRGVGEPLNEVVKTGPISSEGMPVSATYRIQLFNYETTKSAQRQVQKVVDEPLQYFFAMDQIFPNNYQSDLNQAESNLYATTESENGALKIHMIPLAKNSILLRLENLADIFDGSIESQTDYFDIPAYAQTLWDHANQGRHKVQLNDVRITERTLGDNEDMDVWRQEKYQWKTERGSDRQAPKKVHDKAHNVVALQPQRIRLFRLDFIPIM